MKRELVCGVAMWLGASIPALGETALQGPVPLPAPKSHATTQIIRVPYDKLMRVKSLPDYHEPDWVTALVKAGKLPPVAQRLPAEPIVEDMHQTANGDGVYGGILRHVSGGRPQGWNWSAGQTQGTATLDEMQQECLVATGPMWQLTQDRLEPLPDLATSWEWSPDGHQMTMHLLRGAKWSDGQPFTADDIVFFWEDNVSDTSVPARVQPGVYGEGTKLEKLDDFTIRWTFPEVRPIANLYKMGFGGICPGPAHILKPLHPRYNKAATYDSYVHALASDKLPWVTMGAWAVVDYKPDQIIVLRRNPYYHRASPQPVLFQGRRARLSASLSRRGAVQALELGRPHNPDRRRQCGLRQSREPVTLSRDYPQGAGSELSQQDLLGSA
jgi:peptide/nickel transport system substrate-binding protein